MRKGTRKESVVKSTTIGRRKALEMLRGRQERDSK